MPYWMYVGKDQKKAAQYLHMGYQVMRSRTGTYKVYMPGVRKKRKTKLDGVESYNIDSLHILRDVEFKELIILLNRLFSVDEVFEALSLYKKVRQLLLKMYKNNVIKYELKKKIGIYTNNYIENKFKIVPIDFILIEIKEKSNDIRKTNMMVNR